MDAQHNPHRPALRRRSGLMALTAAALLACPRGAPGADTRSLRDVLSLFGKPAAAAVQGDVEPPASSTQPSLVVRDDRVELHVVDLPLSVVLRGLSTQSRRNIIASPGVQGTVTADLFDVSFREAMESILEPNGCTFTERGNFIYVQTMKEKDDTTRQQAVVKEEPTARLFHLNYLTTEDIEPMIKPLLSEQGRTASMPDSSKKQTAAAGTSSGSGLSENGQSLTRPDAIVVIDFPSRLAQIEKIIKSLDIRPRQVLVEATILQATLGERNSLGMDFNVVGGVDFEALSSNSPGVTQLQTGAVPRAELNDTNTTFRTDFNDAVPQGGFTFGIIKDSLAVFLRALEQVTDVTVLANPKVLTLNKQQGRVIVGRRDGYLTTTVTETTATQTVEFLETGTQLVFRPYVSDDGWIRMEIHPEDSSGGLNEQNLPFKRTTEVTTNIMVRDGHTILIGGLFREALTTTRGQVPFLGNIPVAGALLQTNDDNTSREEVIILLTVRVLRDDLHAKASEQVAEDARHMLLSRRKGMQAYGRSRMSQAHYQWALQHLEANRPEKALRDARMSLHLAPAYLPAIQLKNQILDQQTADREVNLVRDFLDTRLKPAELAENAPATRPE